MFSIYKIITLFTFFLLCSLMFSQPVFAKNNNINKQITVKTGNYIIEFEDEPLSVVSKILKNKLKTENNNLKIFNFEESLKIKIGNYREKILKIQNNTKKIISDLTNLKISFNNRFINVFNGLSVKNLPDHLVQKIMDMSYVKNVYPDYKMKACLDESIQIINADKVWNIRESNGYSLTGKGISIGLLDSGVDFRHIDIADSYIRTYNFVDYENDFDYDGHGTHCAGILVGNGKSSNFKYIGVAPDADLYSFKVLDKEGLGEMNWFISAIDRAVDPNQDGVFSDHLDIISISAGTQKPGIPIDPLCNAVNNAVDRGLIVVAAAGNNYTGRNNTITSPGCAEKSICVGSTLNSDTIASFSAKGPVEYGNIYLEKPDIVAPGVKITSTKLLGGYCELSGTSMSTPHVAGAIALLLQSKPELEPSEVKNIIKNNAIDLGYENNIEGSGLLNIKSCINLNQQYSITANYRVNEQENYQINITDKNNEPVNVLCICLCSFCLPKIKHGNSFIFESPKIFGPLRKEKIINVFLINIKEKIKIKIQIFVNNNKFSLRSFY